MEGDPRDLGRGGQVIQEKEESQERFVSKQATTASGLQQTGEPWESVWKIHVRITPLRSKGMGLVVGVLNPPDIQTASCVDVAGSGSQRKSSREICRCQQLDVITHVQK